MTIPTIFILLLVVGLFGFLSGLIKYIISFRESDVWGIRVGLIHAFCGIILCFCAFCGRFVLPKIIDSADSTVETNISGDLNTSDSSEDTVLTSTPVPKKDDDATFKERDKRN